MAGLQVFGMILMPKPRRVQVEVPKQGDEVGHLLFEPGKQAEGTTQKKAALYQKLLTRLETVRARE